MTVAAAIRSGADRLRAIDTGNPRLEARLLLAHALGVEPATLIRDLHYRVETAGFDALLDRRLAHEPLAYLLGHREFWSLDLAVSPATLIPRGDSETVVEAALAAVAAMPGPIRVLDLGTGTGCLLLAVLHDRPDAHGVGVDRVPAAVALAARNAGVLGLADRAAFVCGEWEAPLDGTPFDLVLGNPPYIRSAEIAALMPDVALHEPVSALDGGPDGLDAYRHIVPTLPHLLVPGGVAVLELGLGQSDAVGALAVAAGLTAESVPDLAGIPRALVIRRAGL